jgi:hypothetical protein
MCAAAEQLLSVMDDFDFLIGTYRVHNQVKLADGGWSEFPGINCGTRHLAGQSIVDEFHATFPDGREVNFLDVHVFDPVTQEWTNAIHARGGSPDWGIYRGRFANGVGVFEKVLAKPDGTQALERHTWDRVTGDSARFQQEVSTNGIVWEINWVMHLTRT